MRNGDEFRGTQLPKPDVNVYRNEHKIKQELFSFKQDFCEMHRETKRSRIFLLESSICLERTVNGESGGD